MRPKNLTIVIAIAGAFAALVSLANGQQQPANQCTPAMMTSVGPCMNFLTNSSANATSPSTDCCNSLRSLTSGGMGCLCLIVTGTIPFRIPINRTTAVSLPRACNMPRVPVQCKANTAPAAAPGPASLGPTLSPAATPQSPAISEPTPSAQPPESGTTPLLTPPSPAVDGAAPTASTGGSSRPSLTPSSSAFRSNFSFSPSFLIFILGLVVFKFY